MMGSGNWLRDMLLFYQQQLANHQRGTSNSMMVRDIASGLQAEEFMTKEKRQSLLWIRTGLHALYYVK